MKKYLFLLLLNGFGLFVNAQSDRQLPYMTRSLAGESVKQVMIATTGGNISILSEGNLSETKIEVFVQANNGRNISLSNEEIKNRIADEYDFDISVKNNKLIATATPKQKKMDWKNSLSISFRAYVPANVSSDLTTSGGNINLTGISGDEKFTTSGGNLVLENMSGSIRGRTSGGNIKLNKLKDEIDLSTSGGNIYAEDCSGNMTLSTSGGSLNLNALSGHIHATTSGGNVHGSNIGGDLFANTSGGNIDFKDLSCSLETSTSGGNINISVKQYGKFIKISNSGGNIDLLIPKNTGLDLALNASKIKTSGIENFSGKKEDDEIKGTVNGGGVPVSVSSGSGTIYLSLK